jgi:uncharacterized caspase-like protein
MFSARSCLGRVVIGLVAAWLAGEGMGRTARADETATDADAQPAAASAAPAGKKYALLIGCNVYENFPRGELKGPANDVARLKATLESRCGVPAENIRVLAETPGAIGKPTYDHIRTQFEELAKLAQPGDWVVTLFAGHGAQQPDQPRGSPGADEVDGLDEIFLPCDAGFWNADKQSVERAIVDDELGEWLKAFRKNVHLWTILDACHSGTGLRGDCPERLRKLDMDDLRIPRDAVDAARKRANKQSDEGDEITGYGLFACQANETEKEGQLPPLGKDRRAHGYLTYALCEVLEQGAATTYRELQQRILAQYRAWYAFALTPLVEGPNIDRLVLDVATRPPRFQLLRTDARYSIAAGRLHGLTEGAILAVYRSPSSLVGSDEMVLGHVRVKDAGTAEAKVELCAYGEVPAPAELPEGALCRLVYTAVGEMKLRVVVDRVGRESDGVLQQFSNRIAKLAAEPTAAFQLEPELVREAWAIQFREGKYWLLPGETAFDTAEVLPAETKKFELSPEISDVALGEALLRVAKVQNLLTIKDKYNHLQARDRSTPPAGKPMFGVRVEMLKRRGPDEKEGQPLDFAGRQVTLAPGDQVAWRITNVGRTAADVTLLFIDSELSIKPVFPQIGRYSDNRILPADRFATQWVTVNDKTIGVESVVAIAVQSKGAPIDFLFLAQNSLKSAIKDGVRGESRDALELPLGRLWKYTTFREGATRGVGDREIKNESVEIMSWTVPQPRQADLSQAP